jgi:hypothetical protein
MRKPARSTRAPLAKSGPYQFRAAYLFVSFCHPHWRGLVPLEKLDASISDASTAADARYPAYFI